MYSTSLYCFITFPGKYRTFLRNWNLIPAAYFSSRVKPKNHYETLGLSKTCNLKEIREAFITMSKKYHPDINKNNPKAQEQFVKITEAYNTLIKPQSRRVHDLTLYHWDQTAHTYKPPKSNDYYQVHRYDSHYRDPWKDPSFAMNKQRWKEGSEDEYYGVKGWRKVNNQRILLLIMIFSAVGLAVQIFIIRFGSSRRRLNIDSVSEENRRYLEFVEARADLYNTRERQIEEIRKQMESKPKE